MTATVFRPRWRTDAQGFVARFAGQWAGGATPDVERLRAVVDATPNGSQIEIVELRPVRIQRQRTAGWRMPADAVYVGRPTAWGNPFPVATSGGELFPRDDSVRMFRELVTTGETWFEYGEDRHRFARGLGVNRRVPTVDDIRRELAGRDLVCWCPLHLPCHADVLLEIANAPVT